MRKLVPCFGPVSAALLCIVPLAAVLAAGHTLVWRDTAQLNAALRPLIVDALRAGTVAPWNPYEGAGQPLFAQLLNGVLHPISVVTAMFTRSTDALIVALVAFGGAGAWAAARVLGVTSIASVGSAVAFGCSGWVLGMTANTSYLTPTATAPWLVAGCVVATRRRSGWFVAAAAMAALALAGDPGSGAAFGLVGIALAWWYGGSRGALKALLSATLGVSFAAVQLIPAWSYLADTARGHGVLASGDLPRWALAPWRMLEFVAPGFFVGLPRSYDAPVFAALDGATPDRFPFAPSVFIGASVIVLAGLGAWRDRRARVLILFAALFLWIALGHRAGAQSALSWVPVWGTLRYWEKMVAPLTLCTALAMGFGLDALRDAGARRVALATAAVCGAGALLVGVALAIPGSSAMFGVGGAAAELARVRLGVGVAHAAFAMALLTAVLWACRARPNWTVRGAVAVVYASAVMASPFALHPGSREALEVVPPALEAIPPGPRIAAPLGCDYLAGRAPFDAIDLLNVCERRSGRPSTNAAAGIDAFPTYSSLTPSRWDLIYESGRYFWPLARRFSTTHVVSRAPRTREENGLLSAATDGAAPTQILDGGELLVWNLAHRAWATFAPAVIAVPTRDQAVRTLAREIDLGRETVVVETVGVAPQASPGRVLSVSRWPDGVRVEAESAADGLLVVNDAWAPGWQAMIDGVAAEILPADVLVRGVRWPAGRHVLEMRYTPPGLRRGAAVSALAVLVAVALALWQRVRGAEGSVINGTTTLPSPHRTGTGP